MSVDAIFPSPPRTPLGNLDIHANGAYSPTPSPLYASAKTSLSKPLRRKASQQTFRSHLNESESSQDSSHSSFYDASILSSNPADNIILITERYGDTGEGGWHHTPPRATADVVPSTDEDSAMLTPTPHRRPTGVVARNATPPPLLLHDGLFTTPPKAITHYPHVLEPITERASVATLRTSLSTLRQSSRPLPLGVPLSPPARSISSSISPASQTSLFLPNPRENTPEATPPPPRVPTPLTHPTFQIMQTEKPCYVPVSSPRLDDSYLHSPAEHDLRMHLSRLPQEIAMQGRDDAILPTARFKAVARIPDGHYHPWNMHARRRLLLQEQGTSGKEKRGVREGPGTGMKMGAGIYARNRDAGREVRGEKDIGDGTLHKDGLRDRVKGRGRKNDRGWDRFLGKLSWVCCGVERVRREEEDDIDTEGPGCVEPMRPTTSGRLG